jgi:PAS domain S-box-containing protein
MTDKLRILVLEDNSADAELITRLLTKEMSEPEFNCVVNKEEFLFALQDFKPAVILADNALPQFNAREALELTRQRTQNIPFILVTGSVSEEFAADIIKLGADDYILKDRMIRLPTAIEMAIDRQQVKREKRLAMEEARRSAERFQTLSRATKDAIWDWNLKTNEIWWNENFYELLGYDQNMPAPGPYEWTKRIYPADRNKVMARLNCIAGNGIVSWEDEFRLRLRDGSYGAVLDRGYVLRDELGNPVRVIGGLVNITEQKLLVKEMEVLSLIVRESNNSIVIFDGGTLEISWINEGFTRCTGLTRDDLLLSGSVSLFHIFEAGKETIDMIRSRLRANLPFSGEFILHTSSGEKKWHSLNGQPIPGYDRHTNSYFAIAADISERRRAEEEHLANKIERQKEATRLILQAEEKERNILGRELHDNINQILAAVNLKLGYFLEEPRSTLSIVKDCRKDLQAAIKEIRNLSHHMVTPGFSEIDLKDELELLFGHYYINWSIRFKCEIDHEVKIPAAVKETIFRVSQEQLTNIVKHSAASKVEIWLNIDPTRVNLSICDNGVGFDVRKTGKGIGITNIYSRVESYNGEAKIDSTPGKGCMLSLSIPLLAPMNKKTAAAEAVELSLRHVPPPTTPQ